jgi:flagellar hook-associated protein 1 FlgK
MGIDLNGALGGNMFTLAGPVVTVSTNNTGTGAIQATVNSTSALTARDYSVRFDGTNYSVYDSATNVSVGGPYSVAAMTAGQVVAGTGITLQLTGGVSQANDSFLVRPTANGASAISLGITDPTKIAAASPIRSNAVIANLGSGAIAVPTITAALPFTANPLEDNVTIKFTSATTFDVTDTTLGTTLATGVAYTPGNNISYNGWTTQISGTPSTNDTFTVSRNTNASTDGTNILQMVALQTANTLVNGTTSYQGAYGQLIGQIGSQTRELTVTSKAQTNLLDQVTKAQQSVSGVNLDEEAANLLRYQQAYQAAGKAMQIANTMFDIILNLK